MNEELGLRERKKLRTRAAISTAAIGLFLERGFDAVGVVEVAQVAEVSKRTLFAYFPTKEDLVLHRFADHETDAADVVRARRPGQGALAALREAFRRGLDEREPVTGLCDDPAVVAVFRLVTSTPALVARLVEFASAGESALAGALVEAGRPGPGRGARRRADRGRPPDCWPRRTWTRSPPASPRRGATRKPSRRPNGRSPCCRPE